MGPMLVDEDGDVDLKRPVSSGYDWRSITRDKDEGGLGLSLARHPINEARVRLDARVSIKPSEVNIGDTVTVSMFDYLLGFDSRRYRGQNRLAWTLDLNAPRRWSSGTRAVAEGLGAAELHLRPSRPLS